MPHRSAAPRGPHPGDRDLVFEPDGESDPPPPDRREVERILRRHLDRKADVVRALLTAFEDLATAPRSLPASALPAATPAAQHDAAVAAVSHTQRLRETYREAWVATLREGWTPRELGELGFPTPLPPRHRR